ncbi:MAG: hypothetical protein LBT17_01805 [Mycoplasmataceae bacterium]|nr:hypothetical protein [Mycoplasmataceae bacterium]
MKKIVPLCLSILLFSSVVIIPCSLSSCSISQPNFDITGDNETQWVSGRIFDYSISWNSYFYDDFVHKDTFYLDSDGKIDNSYKTYIHEDAIVQTNASISQKFTIIDTPLVATLGFYISVTWGLKNNTSEDKMHLFKVDDYSPIAQHIINIDKEFNSSSPYLVNPLPVIPNVDAFSLLEDNYITSDDSKIGGITNILLTDFANYSIECMDSLKGMEGVSQITNWTSSWKLTYDINSGKITDLSIQFSIDVKVLLGLLNAHIDFHIDANEMLILGAFANKNSAHTYMDKTTVINDTLLQLSPCDSASYYSYWLKSSGAGAYIIGNVSLRTHWFDAFRFLGLESPWGVNGMYISSYYLSNFKDIEQVPVHFESNLPEITNNISPGNTNGFNDNFMDDSKMFYDPEDPEKNIVSPSIQDSCVGEAWRNVSITNQQGTITKQLNYYQAAQRFYEVSAGDDLVSFNIDWLPIFVGQWEFQNLAYNNN